MKKTVLFLFLLTGFLSQAQCYEYIKFGGVHSIGYRSDGTYWGWGTSGNGQLATNILANPNPVLVNMPENTHEFFIGPENTFVIKTDGTLWATGSNLHGGLGVNSTTTTFFSFQQVTTATNWQKVAPSQYFTIALRTDGTIWGCGQNDFFQTGSIPTSAAQRDFRQIGTASDWVDIAVGDSRTAFALKADGTLWGWGQNQSSILLNGNPPNSVNTPTQVGTANDWVKFRVGNQYILAQKADGTLWSWGGGPGLGLGGTPSVTHFAQQISNGTWKSFAAGLSRGYGVKSDGTLWAWGINNNGILGDGTTQQQLSPVQIGTDNDWEDVQSFRFQTTMATKTDGSVWYWGTNYYGEFGNGNSFQEIYFTTPQLSPGLCVTPLNTPTFEQQAALEIYPNPASSAVTLKTNTTEQALTYAIYDLSGRLIRQAPLDSTATTTLALDAFESGVYLVTLFKDNQKVSTQKLIVK